MSKAERIIDFQMLDALIETTINKINEDVSLEIEAYNGYLHKRFQVMESGLKAPNYEHQRKFALKLINQLKILIDLLQL